MIKSLKSRESKLSESQRQIEILSSCSVQKFTKKLEEQGRWPLVSKHLEILQVNVGYMCNQTCEHCHVDAGPDRKEIMSKETMLQCLQALDNSQIKTVDITGGAPEMNPHFLWFIEELSNRGLEIIVRSNLTILEANKKYQEYPELFVKYGVTVIASLPCYTEENTDKQRGTGVFNDSINALKKLNSLGYGIKENLKLHLVYNPGGPTVAPDQLSLEKDYKRELKSKFDIVFNNLYTITNLPISRYLDYLLVIGKYEEYMIKLVNAFNSNAVQNVMCINTLSVDWKGGLYDCDFNQMLELPLNNAAPQTISEFNLSKIEGRNIVVNNHCYGCTAGAGSSCQGAIT